MDNEVSQNSQKLILTVQSLIYLKRISNWIIPLIVFCAVIALVSFFELFVRLSVQEYPPVFMNLLSFVLSSYASIRLLSLNRLLRKGMSQGSEELLGEAFGVMRKLLLIICIFFGINLAMLVIIGFVG
ncbi:hypothetical protein LNQ81_03290 [Myroides sp. M-43]|uniref:hypothetical protein n=1 Tax=Myroides oncorhynchi TaxID=2893756 RepID=UPI001E649401|nr:hypothetical protein [Myroides oncorhynchi]MCC9041725.1 hypothetical protein [Myroides oncorhynchi]